MEILGVDEEIRELLLHRASADAIREAAVGKGMLTLRDAGFQRVRQGLTTLEEVLRATRHG